MAAGKFRLPGFGARLPSWHLLRLQKMLQVLKGNTREGILTCAGAKFNLSCLTGQSFHLACLPVPHALQALSFLGHGCIQMQDEISTPSTSIRPVLIYEPPKNSAIFSFIHL